MSLIIGWKYKIYVKNTTYIFMHDLYVEILTTIYTMNAFILKVCCT